jgi:hypothetical protein
MEHVHIRVSFRGIPKALDPSLVELVSKNLQKHHLGMIEHPIVVV